MYKQHYFHSNICLFPDFHLLFDLRICSVHIKNHHVRTVLWKAVRWNGSVIKEILLIYLSHELKSVNTNHCQCLRLGFTGYQSKI